MKFLVDMNLSPKWCQVFAAEGWDAVHWVNSGKPQASDQEIMAAAASEGRIVITNDLDFGTLLAVTRAVAPSVVQVRCQDLRPAFLAPLLLPVLRQYESQLLRGALLVIDESRSRVRILPFPP